MVATHPHLTIQKRNYAEINWAHECAGLVTNGVAGRRVQLQPVADERLIALEGIGEMPSDVPDCPNWTAEAVRSNGKRIRARRRLQCRRGANGSQPAIRATGNT